jgi:prepilin-type processing-associated H-X9-DG protein
LTSYVVVVGDPTDDEPQSLFMPNHWVKLGEILDGTSRTIMIVETSHPVPWTQPDADPTLEQFLPVAEAAPLGLASNHPRGTNVAMADGSVKTLGTGTPGTALRLLLAPSDGQAVRID